MKKSDYLQAQMTRLRRDDYRLLRRANSKSPPWLIKRDKNVDDREDLKVIVYGKEKRDEESAKRRTCATPI